MQTPDPNQPKEMAYDLRQIRAKLVGDHMLDVAENRKANNFYNWFMSLQDLYSITHQKFKERETASKTYKELITTAANLANKYSATWSGTNRKQTEIFDIDRALRNVEEFLYEQMEDCGMFGTAYAYDEDEV